MSEASINQDDLPTTWALTNLGSVINYGSTNKAEPHEIADDDWILELEDIEKDSSRLLQKMTFLQRQSKSTKNRFQTGDVLYGKLRPYLNKVLIAGEPGYCTTEILPLKTGTHIDNQYLFYWLKHPVFLKYVEAESHGMNMPRLGTETGKAAPFVLAPRNEQTRIASQLETLLTRVQTCNDRFDAIPALLKRFRQTVLDAAVSGELTIDWRETERAQSWPTVSIGAMTVNSYYGPRFGKDEYTELSTGVPTIRTTDMDRVGRIHISVDTPRVLVPAAKIEQYRVKPGDLLVTRTGSIGVMAVFDGNYLAIPSAYLIRFRFNENLRTRFAYYRLAAPIGQSELGLSTTAVTQPNVNAEAIKRIEFGLPTVEEQDEIIRRVEAFFALTDRIEARFTAARAQAQRLTPLVLAKAFRGELVAQDPNDEPASALLARIASSNTAVVGKNKQKVPVARKERA